MSRANRGGWLAPVVTILMIALLAFAFGTDYLANEWKLHKIAGELRKLPMPPKSERLGLHKAFGLLSGCGNHCDYFVGLLCRADLSRDEVLKHYAGRTFLNPVTNTVEAPEVEVVTSEAGFGTVAELPDDMAASSAWGVSAADFGKGTLYLVCVRRSYGANRDWRCH